MFDAINLVSGSAITSYDDLSNRPRLNTANTTAQVTSGDETLTGLVKLHKISKTGTYSDLIGTPTIPAYAANIALSTSANYITEPEFKNVKINGSTTNAASSENCELQYDTENKCVKFVFN